jgi:hypothetical protein
MAVEPHDTMSHESILIGRLASGSCAFVKSVYVCLRLRVSSWSWPCSPGGLALIACIAQLSTAYSCPFPGRPCHLGPAHPAGDRLPSQLLTAQRATLAELLAELPEADQRHLAAALESLRAVLARHPGR